MDVRLMAAKLRFPSRSRAIEERAARDEEFRDLCTDFRDAQAAQLHWERSTEPERDERSAEYLALVDDLAREIASALDKAKIIPFHKRWPKPLR
ncbi:hypothetical protein [Candidatus Phyllobacterium onerii]|uniref:hypothetical protein n=1 Tax=Candidatus Phyllobacterium onerii TaxID=3020828 RepID=UPI00232B4042|nr:hypothetical protein [Phyllobacterium sp. IY22]